jgi:ubiquinone/menaquinone biosynthesis C-methylase UbiE
VRPPDPDSLRYQRYWEPVLAAPAERVLERIGAAPATFLDLGSGTGSLTLAAAARWPHARVVAVDASAGMLAVARQRASEMPHHPLRFEWHVADAAELPLAGGSVDAVGSSFVLQLLADRPTVLTEIRRVLAPAGVFAFVTWLADELELPADEVFLDTLEALDLDGFDADDDAFRSPRPLDYTSPDEARRELLDAGFEAVEVTLDELRFAWTALSYLEWKERYDEREAFEDLDVATRARLRETLARRLAALPADAFELRGPLVAAVARRPRA